MKKSDLKHGNVVETRNGNKWLFCWDLKEDKLIDLKGRGYETLDCHYEDLTYFNGFIQLDIMKVYKDYTLTELLWERKDPKLTEDEKVILKNIPKEYKWIVRDECGELWVYQTKPIKRKNVETWDYSIEEIDSGKFYNEDLSCFAHLFKFIKWEDDEPYLIEDLLEGEEK